MNLHPRCYIFSIALFLLWGAAIPRTMAAEAAAQESNNNVGLGLESGPPLGEPASILPQEVELSLRQTQDLGGTTNLLASAGAAREQRERLTALEDKLALARQQRREKDYEQSEKNLKLLLHSDAGMEIKRSAMLEMALLAQDQKKLVRAQQVFSQYVHQFPEDPSIPEILLRQGLLYREMGAPVLALSKFYTVMSSALNLKLDKLWYYQRLVLQAQTEIADTYYLQGKYDEAAEFFNRLLRLDNPELNQAQILYKLVRCYYYGARYSEAVAQAEVFVKRHASANQLPEVRFLFSDALRRLGRKADATKQVLALLEGQRDKAAKDPEGWRYWQQRTGNEIANQFYQEGDYLNALEIYRHLGEIDSSLEWQLPVWYQTGLVYERLKQPEKAQDMYQRIVDRQKDPGTNAPSPNLVTVLEMAKWRKDHLAWHTQAEFTEQTLVHPIGPLTLPSAAKP